MAANIRKGLGKSFDKIFGEGTINQAPVSTQGTQSVVATEVNKPEPEVQIVEKIVEKIVEVPVAGENADGTPLYVNINLVQANPEQPRKYFDEDKIKELAESIENYGVIEPIVVRKTSPVHYEVIAGERRLRAARVAGLEKVPVIVKDYDDRQRKEIAIIENVQREDLNAIEKALGYKALIDEYDMTQEALAVKIGKSRASITNALRILSLDERIIELIKNGELSEGHARSLLSIDDEELRAKIAERVINEKMSVRKIEDLIRVENLAKKRKSKGEELNTDAFKKLKIQIKDIERTMRDKLDASLKVLPKNEQSGIIEIKYTSQEELDRIYLLINSINKGI